MHPSFGVPWPRLQRAAARLTQLHSAPAERGRVPALLFLCGLKYLLTYREATGRRLSHYLDDGLREAVDYTLPVLMKRAESPVRLRRPRSRVAAPKRHSEFEQLITGFMRLQERFPSSTARWLATHEGYLVRLAFGFGVSARFAPESHDFVRRMLDQPLRFPVPVLDVLESFRWDPEWSIVLTG
jgi:hypothetical protein